MILAAVVLPDAATPIDLKKELKNYVCHHHIIM